MNRSFWEILGLIHIGLFFNNFLPSSIDGDAIRGFYASNSREEMATSYGALLVERVIGMIALAAMCALAAAYALGYANSLPQRVLVAAVALSLTICVLGVGTLAGAQRLVLRTNFLTRFPRLDRLARGLISGWSVLNRSDRNWRIVIGASIVLQVLGVIYYLYCARALSIGTPAVMFFVVVPIAVVASMLPVSLNGLGVREGTFVTLLYQQGVPLPTAGAFALLALAVATLFSVAGGVLYAFWSPARKRA